MYLLCPKFAWYVFYRLLCIHTIYIDNLKFQNFKNGPNVGKNTLTNQFLSDVYPHTPILQYLFINIFPYQNIYTCWWSTKCLTRLSIGRTYSRHWGHGCIFLGHIFWEKGILFAYTPYTDVILTISNENIFPKIQGTKLDCTYQRSRIGPDRQCFFGSASDAYGFSNFSLILYLPYAWNGRIYIKEGK